MKVPNVSRGDIFYADLDPVVGSEQGGVRPVLVVQNDMGNHYSPTVIIAPLTARIKKELPTHMVVGGNQFGLSKDSVILLEQIRTIDKQRLHEKTGHMPKQIMDEVDSKINLSLGTVEVKAMDEIIKIESHFGRLTVSSREVAENFEKEHSSVVVRAIENLINDLGSVQNCTHLFYESKYQNEQNKQWYKEYLLTRDGFSLLVMGFTGQKALEWKLKYIEAFNKMESSVKEHIPSADYSSLSPELQAIRIMIDDMAKQKLEISQLSGSISAIKETIIMKPDNWRQDINRMINKIVSVIGDGKFQELRHESYALLENRAHVNLERRLANMRARMWKEGATKTAIGNVCKMDVIEADPKLREIFASIIKEYTIKYVA